jgi:hypothetical protein
MKTGYVFCEGEIEFLNITLNSGFKRFRETN